MSDHVEVADLLAYARGGRIPERRLDTLLTHCETCVTCGDELAAAMLLGQRVPVGQRNRWLAVAALILAAVALSIAAYSFFGVGPPDRQTEELASLATQETLPRPHLRFVPGLALVDEEGFALRPAVELLVDRRYEEATSILENFHQRKPQDPEIRIYLSIALYLSGDRSDRPGAFLSAASESAPDHLKWWADWYLANFYLATGEPQRAAAVLDALATLDHYPGRLAIDLLAELPPEVYPRAER